MRTRRQYQCRCNPPSSCTWQHDWLPPHGWHNPGSGPAPRPCPSGAPSYGWKYRGMFSMRGSHLSSYLNFRTTATTTIHVKGMNIIVVLMSRRRFRRGGKFLRSVGSSSPMRSDAHGNCTMPVIFAISKRDQITPLFPKHVPQI